VAALKLLLTVIPLGFSTVAADTAPAACQCANSQFDVASIERMPPAHTAASSLLALEASRSATPPDKLKDETG
jgi:hypothetical protein